MIKKSNFLKNLLTTASVIAVTTSASSAMGAVRTVNSHTTLTTAGVTAGLLDGTTTWLNADSLDYNANTANSTLTTTGDVTIVGIDLTNNAPGLFTVANNVSLGAVTSTGGAQYLPITVASDKELTLTATSALLGDLILSDDVVAGATTLAIDAGVNATFTKLNAANAGNGTLSFAGASTFTGADIGTTAALATVKIGAGIVDLDTATTLKATTTELGNAASEVTFSTASDITTDFKNTSGTVGQGTVNFALAHTVNGNVGEADNALAAVSIGNGLVEFKTATIFNATTTTLGHNDSIVTFTNDVTVTSNFVATNTANNGALTFDGKAILDGTIGAVGQAFRFVEFTKDSTISKDIHSVDIIFNASTITVAKDLTLTGTTTMTGTTLTAGANNVTIAGAASTLNGDMTFNTTISDTANGSIVVDAVALTGANTAILTTNITDTRDIKAADETYEIFTLANAGTIATIDNKLGTTTSNRFVTYAIGAATGTLTRSNTAAAGMNTLLAGKVSAATLTDAQKIININNTGDAVAFRKDLITMSDAEASEAVQRAVETTALQAQNVAAQATGAVSGAINTRMNALPSQGASYASGASGVSAGEGDQVAYGAWMTPFYNSTTQKELKGVAGFESKSTGVAIGFDSKVNEDLTIGVAGSYAKTDMKHKNAKSGDKTKADTFAFSLYAIQQLSNNWFLQGQTSYSTNKFKSDQKRVITGGSETAKGKFTNSAYTAALLAGYDYMLSNVTMTPLAGVSFTRINGGSYKETGTTSQNLTVLTKATNKLEAVLGLKAQMTHDMDGINITPEMHAFVKQDLIGKNGKVTVRQAGMVDDFSVRTGNSQKTKFNVGLGLTAVSGMYEYGAGYDLNMAEKSVGHQGTLKLRLNF